MTTSRRIDQLRYQASLIPLSKDEVRQFGKLTQTATWEKAIAFHNAVDSQNKWIEPQATDVPIVRINSPESVREWFDLRLVIVTGAICFATSVVFSTPYLVRFFPVRVTIQIGTK